VIKNDKLRQFGHVTRPGWVVLRIMWRVLARLKRFRMKQENQSANRALPENGF